MFIILFFILSAAGIRDAAAVSTGDSVQLPKSDADRQTFLNNVTDFLTTAGQSPDEKARTIKERKAIRREERLRNLRRKHDQRVQKQLKQQQKDILDKVNAVNQSRYNKKK